MDSVIHAHNSMNEITWGHVMAWESLHRDHCCSPSLLRFRGRPDDLRWEHGPWARAVHRGFESIWEVRDLAFVSAHGVGAACCFSAWQWVMQRVGPRACRDS